MAEKARQAGDKPPRYGIALKFLNVELCLEDCSRRLEDYSRRFASISGSQQIYNAYLRSGLTFLDGLLFDVFIFLSRVEKRFDSQKNGYGFGKRNIANSSEVFEASVAHLHHHLKYETFSSFFQQPISVFLIRQAIELRIKNAIGVVYVSDLQGDILKITPDFFIDFVFDRKEIRFLAVSKSVIKKIHSWSNYFVHAGFFMPVWQVWFAQRVIRPMFEAGQKQGAGWSIYGAVEIDKAYYQSALDDDIKAYICQRTPKRGLQLTDITIEKIRPEALLV